MSPVPAAGERDSNEVLLEDTVKRQGFQGEGLEASGGGGGGEAEPPAHHRGCVEQTDMGKEQPQGIRAQWVGRGARRGKDGKEDREKRRRWGERMGRIGNQKT